MKSIVLLFFFVVSAFSVNYAQVQKHSDDTHGHHDHHKNEIALANSAAYLLNESEFSYGMHVHYTRKVLNDFGIGLGYERIFDDHKHNTIGLVLNYHVIEKLGLAISPGIAFSELETKGQFALHLEATYEFEFKDFHIGPVVEYAFDSDDKHISFGIHIGYGF